MSPVGQIDLDASRYLSLGIEGLFYILALIFVMHALFLGYHWFSYGNSRSMSLLALAIYLGGGAILLLTFSLAMTMI